MFNDILYEIIGLTLHMKYESIGENAVNIPSSIPHYYFDSMHNIISKNEWGVILLTRID